MGIYMKLKVAVCDDEQNQTEYIASLVSEWGAHAGLLVLADCPRFV